MRLSFSVATILLIQQFTHIVGFSILPITSPRRTTSLALSAISAERKKPLKSAERARNAAGLPEKEEDEDPKLFEESQYDDMQKILLTLEKRVKEGPGFLSLKEVEEFKTASDRILVEMKKKDAEHVGSLSAAAVPPAVAAPAKKAAPAAPAPVAAVQEAQGDDLRTAASQMDATTVSTLLEAGLEMDEATTDAAFWAVVKAVDRAEEQNEPLSADVPKMLHHIFDADLRHLLGREKLTTNVTCMQPAESGIGSGASKMNYIFDDAAHKDLPLTEGRRCEDGMCCEACSRNIFPTFASEAETSLETFPELASLTFNDLENVSAGTILQFARLVERVRRTMAHEYGLPLSSLLPLQAYSRKYVAGTTQQGGGGGEGDFVTLHTDEATHSGYHYSCVLYLNTQGKDFEGGDFVFNDPKKKDEAEGTDVPSESIDEEEMPYMSLAEEIRRAGRELTPFHPTQGSAVIFSSGWENMHEVEQITSGVRYTVPCFFTTCPVPEAAYEQMVVGKPKTDEDIADDWLHLLLAHRKEMPNEAVGRVKELLMKWHYMCTPLSEH